MTSLFATLLGAGFETLDPRLRRVHGGVSRTLNGRVSVARGTSLIARGLCRLTNLPPDLNRGPIEVRLEVAADKERWVRLFDHRHRMVSTLSARHGRLCERLGLVALTFRLVVRQSGLYWMLERVAAFGIPLPASLFLVSATIDVQEGRYHFYVDAGLLRVGRVVCYEGVLDDAG